MAESSKLFDKKLFLVLTKYIPHIVGILYVIYTLAAFVDIDLISIGYICSMSLLPWIYFYSASKALEFCYVHRLPLYYIAIDEFLLLIDNYLHIPLSEYNLFMLHLLIVGTFSILYGVWYVKFKLKRQSFGLSC